MRRLRYIAIVLLFLPISAATAAEPAATQDTEEAKLFRAIQDAQNLMDTSEDTKQIQAIITSKDPDQVKRVASVIAEKNHMHQQAVIAAKHLNEVAKAKFNKPLVPEEKPLSQIQDSLKGATVKIDNDQATIELAVPMPGKKPAVITVKLTRVNGTWKRNVDDIPAEKMETAVKNVSLIEIPSTEAQKATAKEIEDGKYATFEAALEGLNENSIRSIAKAKKAAAPSVQATPLNWDLSKSHKLADVGWPKDQTGMTWIWENHDEVFDLAIKLPGLNEVTVRTQHPEVSCGFRKKAPPLHGTENSDEIRLLSFGFKEYLTAKEVRAFAEKLGMNERVKAKLVAWPPENPGTNIYDFKQPFAGGGGVRLLLLNAQKFTGERDSWGLSIQAGWSDSPPGYWDSE